jgi:glycosyltransferase AglD
VTVADTPNVSLVLACYNEAEVIEESVSEIVETLDDLGRPWEILFVDDASRDRTRELLARIVAAHPEKALRVILHERNQGRGATVSDGFRAARGEITGYLDIDLEVHCRYIPSLVKAIEKGADVATLRRVYLFRLRALDREILSRGYSWLVKRVLGVPLYDTETGYKFFRRERLLPLLDLVRDPGWFWDTEIMVRAHRAGLVIREIPGAFVRRFDKTSKVSGIRDSLDYLLKLWRFRAALRRGDA